MVHVIFSLFLAVIELFVETLPIKFSMRSLLVPSVEFQSKKNSVCMMFDTVIILSEGEGEGVRQAIMACFDPNINLTRWVCHRRYTKGWVCVRV